MFMEPVVVWSSLEVDMYGRQTGRQEVYHLEKQQGNGMNNSPAELIVLSQYLCTT
jgi:hypothetical protein